MPRFDIVGVRRVDMDADNIHGFSIFTTHPEDGVDGLMAEKFFLRDAKLAMCGGVIPAPGMTIDFEWGRSKGSIDLIRSLE